MKDAKDIKLLKASEKPKLSGARGVIVRICNVLSLVVLTAVVTVAAGLLVSQLLGIKPMAVLSGSMEPAYATGSVVFVDTNADTDSVAVGDAITYSLAGGDTVVTHRVISIDNTQDTFTTKGDANNTIDCPVPFENLIGKAANFYIPYIGFLLTLAGTPQGWAIALFALAFILVLLMVPVILTPAKPSSKAETATESGEAKESVAKLAAGKLAQEGRAKKPAQGSGSKPGAHSRAKGHEVS